MRDVPASDREQLLPLLQESFSGIYLRHATRTIGEVEKVRVAEVGAEQAGLTMLKLLSKEAGYVYYVAVRPSYRRKGLGTRLLMDALEIFTSEGVGEVYASVGEHNVESKALFLGQGFRKTNYGEVSKKYGIVKSLSMYRSMWVVPGEMLLVKDALTLPASI